MKTLIVLLSLVLIATGLGCVALSGLITPADVDQRALQYAINAGVADHNDYNAWYPNLDEATRLKEDVDSANVVKQQKLRHLMEKDTTEHGIHRKVTTYNLTTAKQREEILFGEAGLLPLGLSMLGAGGFAGLLGLMRKRPGDVTAPEMEQALATVKGKATDELSTKEKQFVQLVKGVQAFMDIPGMGAGEIASLKTTMNEAQDKDTQAAVTVIKKTT